jgi:hypothetical protein
MTVQQEIVDWAGVSNDEAAHSSDSQPLKRSDFSAQIVDRVIHPDIMSLQKTVQLITSIETQQPTYFRLGDAPSLIFLYRKRFERTTRQIAAACAEALGKIVGNFDVQVYAVPWRILSMIELCTPPP